MKTTITKISLVLLFFIASIGVNAQEDAKKKEEQQKQKIEADKRATAELVIGLPKVSEKNLFVITGTTEKISGLVFVQFCEQHKVALFNYDKELFQKPEDVVKAFEERNVIMPMYVKPSSFKEIKEMCAQ
ncbi:MAG TPA: hypothetical protein VGF30_07715 [Bacteroidia bacterium]